jgi:beta-N-acetylhexosaminidase
MKEQVGQLFMIGFDGTSVSAELADFIREHRPGGVILFARNLEQTAQIVQLINELQRLSPEQPLLVAIDQEGGRVSRLPAGFTVFPSCAALGQCESPDLVYRAAAVTAAELRAVGINMNMAPVLDVDTNPRNPIIGDRAFGTDPERVGELGRAAFTGLQDCGVIACGKHFPGHGDTSADSHVELPSVTAPVERLEQTELRPFRHAITHGVATIMTAHVMYPALDPTFPATLSSTILTGLLRRKLGFAGVVVTDDLEMRAILDHYGIEEAAVRAVHAGADLLLICKDPDRIRLAMKAMRQAVERGTVSPERLDASIRRIAALKATYLQPYTPADPDAATRIIGSRSHQALLASIQSRGRGRLNAPVA